MPQSAIIGDLSFHGFYTLGLFYPSAEGQNGCAASRTPMPTDLNCTARERQRVLTGEAVSTHTNVTVADSIFNRVAKALAHLGAPWSGWLDATGTPKWEGIIIAGHSNGADHAAFLAKTYRVARGLFFSGPNDYVGPKHYGTYSTAAPWQSAKGATPPTSLFGFGLCGNLPAHGERHGRDCAEAGALHETAAGRGTVIHVLDDGNV